MRGEAAVVGWCGGLATAGGAVAAGAGVVAFVGCAGSGWSKTCCWVGAAAGSAGDFAADLAVGGVGVPDSVPAGGAGWERPANGLGRTMEIGRASCRERV